MRVRRCRFVLLVPALLFGACGGDAAGTPPVDLQPAQQQPTTPPTQPPTDSAGAAGSAVPARGTNPGNAATTETPRVVPPKAAGPIVSRTRSVDENRQMVAELTAGRDAQGIVDSIVLSVRNASDSSWMGLRCQGSLVTTVMLAGPDGKPLSRMPVRNPADVDRPPDIVALGPGQEHRWVVPVRDLLLDGVALPPTMRVYASLRFGWLRGDSRAAVADPAAPLAPGSDVSLSLHDQELGTGAR